MSAIKLSIYSAVTSGDRSTTETAVVSDIPGELQFDRRRMIDGETKEEVEYTNVFFPEKYISGVVNFQKAVDVDDNIYKILHVEDYDSHQEIYMRKAGI